MRKWILVCAVVALAGFLAEPAPAQESVPAPTKVVTATETGTVAPRASLFRRFRERRGTTTVVQPVVRTETTSTPSGVQQAQATQPATTVTTQPQVVETRQGLLSRLRERRGR